MKFQRTTLAASPYIRSLAWNGDVLVDWVSGWRYPLDAPGERFNVGTSYRFDAAAGLGSWGVGYEALGTKGRILRDNGVRATSPKVVPLSVDVVREIDRSYYHADDYWFPVTLFHALGERPVIAHCPRGYDVLDLEDLETGTCLTPRPKEIAEDIFHSRLEASLDGRWLVSNGWVWAPANVVCLYDVERALDEPAYLSTYGEESLRIGDEIDAVAFAGERLVCLISEDSNRMLLYDLRTRASEVVDLEERAGTRAMGLDDDHIVLFDGHPRVLQLSTGKIVERWEDLDGGAGLHQPSASMKPPTPPWLACDPAHRRFALGTKEGIEVVSA